MKSMDEFYKNFYKKLNEKFWGMAEVLPYLPDNIDPSQEYELMRDLERLSEKLHQEGEL